MTLRAVVCVAAVAACARPLPPGAIPVTAAVEMPSPAVEAHVRLAWEAQEAGAPDTASDHFRTALAGTPPESRFDGLREMLLLGLGTAAPDPEEGARASREGLALAERRGAPPLELAYVRMGLGARLRHAGRCEEALAVLEEGLSLAAMESASPPPGLLLNLGNASRDCGDVARARSFYAQALPRADAAWLRALLHYGLAAVDVLDGEPEAGLAAIDASLRESERGGIDAPALVRTLDLRACILRASGRAEEAQASAARADAIVRDHPAAFAGAGARGLGVRLDAACPRTDLGPAS